MNRKQRIEDALRDRLNPVYMDIVDETYMHSVPPNSESHFKVLVVSDAFTDIAMLERHRCLNELLGDEFKAGLHALTMHTWTPDEWHHKGGVPESPPCLGGSNAA